MPFLKDSTRRLHALAGQSPRWLARAAQVAIFCGAAVTAFLLRFEFSIPPAHLHQLTIGLAVWIPVKSLIFHLWKLDRGWWRFVSTPDLVRVGAANLIASAAGGVLILLSAPHGFPRSILLLDFLLCALGTAGIRLAARLITEFDRGARPAGVERALIYGAGAAGVMLLREARSNPEVGYSVCGLIDDDVAKRGMRILGVPVLGPGSELGALVEAHGIAQVLIALPSATGAQMTEILNRCHRAQIKFRTIPSFREVIEGKTLTAQVRDVAVEDLLGRRPVHLDESRILAKIEGRVVAVTGAAGSIGSELCRQIARFRPAAIVAYECAESALFHIESEMREKFPGVAFHPEIGDIRNLQRFHEVLDRRRPSILYHAAAYKHVPMMEAHPFEAIENNVLGTWNVATAAAQHGVEDFVMISSDKAVRPTNIMGATKRVAELVIRSLQNGGPTYVSVRFGNVLGSNGSVVPIFKQQIAAGGPVTVTHPEMRRYFMTIPEAVQLVLQASTMGKGGEIFVLDMGEPVRIVDLARNLILLSGLKPGQDVRIEFSGIRPGEKLHEELCLAGEDTLPTFHEKIKVFSGAAMPLDEMRERLRTLRRLCESRDCARLVLELKEIVPDYNPSTGLLRSLFPQEVQPGLLALKNAVGSREPVETASFDRPAAAVS